MPFLFQDNTATNNTVYIPTGTYTVTTSITISTTYNISGNWFNATSTPYSDVWQTTQVADTDWQHEYDKETKKKQAAKKKALTLLRMNLSRKQWNNYKELGYFEVISQKGNVYRIYEGRSRNIKRVKEGKVVEVLCAHPKDQVPTGDTLLSQKLMLECMEDTFRHIANIDRIAPNADSLNEWFEVAA